MALLKQVARCRSFGQSGSLPTIGGEKHAAVVFAPAGAVTHELVYILCAVALATGAAVKFFEVVETDVALRIEEAGFRPPSDEEVLAVKTALLQTVMMQTCAGAGDGDQPRWPYLLVVRAGVPLVSAILALVSCWHRTPSHYQGVRVRSKVVDASVGRDPLEPGTAWLRPLGLLKTALRLLRPTLSALNPSARAA